MNDNNNPLNVALDNSVSFKYKASLLGKATDADGNDRLLKNANIVVPLKYLSNFFRSLEMSLINCKIHLELKWNNNCVMYGANTYAGGDNANNRETTFKITSAELYVPVVSLSTKDNVNLTKHLNEGFKSSVFWDEYKSKIETETAEKINLQDFLLMLLFKELIDCSFLLLITLLRMMLKFLLAILLIEFKETVTENIFCLE